MLIGYCLPLLSALFLGLTFAFFILNHHFKKHKPIDHLPNGSMGWPFCGETLSFLKPHRSDSLGTFLQQHCSRYGKVFKSHVFGSPAIVSCDHELNMFILQNEEKLFRVSYPKSMHGILGKFSLLIVSDELHRKLRNIAVGFIATSRSNPAFLETAEKLVISMMESWKDLKEIAFYKECKKFTLNLMVKQLMSIEPEDPLASTILEDFRAYMKGFVSLPLDIPGSPYAKAVKARERLASTVKAIIKEREEEGSVRITKGDFLDVILSKQKLSDEEIVSIVLDIVLGGYETTSTFMALIVYLLAHSTSAFQTLKEEHENISRSKEKGEDLDMKDYEKMEFTLNVIYEAMRCGNVVKFVHRKPLEMSSTKMVFNCFCIEYMIPSDGRFYPCSQQHILTHLFTKTLEFNPWRWTASIIFPNFLVGRIKVYNAYTQLFKLASGQLSDEQKGDAVWWWTKIVSGAELAKVEIAFFLHHLVLNYRWKTKADDFPVAYPYVEFQRGLLLEIEPTHRK